MVHVLFVYVLFAAFNVIMSSFNAFFNYILLKSAVKSATPEFVFRSVVFTTGHA